MRLRAIVMALVLITGGAWGVAQSAQRQLVPPWREAVPSARATAEIVVGETPVEVELALTTSEQTLGLGYRNDLAADRGMLFVFGDPAERTFWMKGMRFCLDIIWIADGEILGAEERVCPAEPGADDADLESYLSDVPVTHVLEMNAGWLDAQGYGAGTPVEIPASLN